MKITLHSWSLVGKAVLLGLTLGILTYVLYFHKLNTLLPGYSSDELLTYQRSLDWHGITANIANATYYSVVWTFTALLGHHGIGVGRTVSASMGIIVVALFYFVTRLRYSFWVAFLGTLLFATSAGFLHAARLGTPQVMQLGVLAFIGAVLWYRNLHKHRILAGYALAVLFGTLLYIPGMVWFQAFGLILMLPGLRRQLQNMTWQHKAGWIGAFAATILPLLYFGMRHPQSLRDIMGLPHHIVGLSHAAINVFNTAASIFVRSNGDATLWLGHAPLLNAIEIVLVAIGAYVLLYTQRSKRGIFLVGSIILGLLLASIGGSVTIMCIVPLLYLFIVEGVDNLLSQWTTVFPRNPFARASGIILICGMLFFSVLYQTRSYFVAWPHNPQTKQTFHLQPPA